MPATPSIPDLRQHVTRDALTAIVRCAAILPIVAIWPSTAHAQSDCLIPPAGEVLCEDVVIDDQLTVSPYDATSAQPTGYLHIRARSITITETGGIDASGAGFGSVYVGTMPTMPTDGGGPGGGTRGVPIGAGAPAPGGGGAHVGIGGRGLASIMPCAPSATALGGVAYDDATAPLAAMDPFASLGSAGAASHCGDTGDQQRAGGRGGGVIMLSASTITIAGAVRADGQGRAALGDALFGCGPGAGAGGAIIVVTHELSMTGAGLLSAAGGESPRSGDPAPRSWGGGGGGGLITVFAGVAPTSLNTSVSGGAADCPGGVGGDGALASLASVGCLDADGDGHPSVACGGPDCHDGATAIGPDGMELCDGVDNDCDGDVDEEPDSLCPSGSGTTCRDGSCQPIDAAAGGSDAAPPPEVVLGGGLCAASPAGSSSGSALWLWLTALGCAAWRRDR